MDPVEYEKYDDYKNFCYSGIYTVSAIIITILLIAFLYKQTAYSLSYIIIGGGICTLIIAYKEPLCKNNYNSAWAQMKSFGYNPNVPETLLPAKNAYYMNNRWQPKNINRGLTINI